MTTQISRITAFDGTLIRELVEKSGVPRPDPNPEFFDNEKNIMLVSRTDGELSGFLWAYVLIRPDRPAPMMFLYSIDVFETFRRRGTGTLLIQHLKEIARTYNCFKMFIPTGKDNIPAIALYRTTGGIASYDGVNFTYEHEALTR